MQSTYHINNALHSETAQQSLNTTITVPPAKQRIPKDVKSALNVTGIAMGGIFVFMLIFFFIIKGIDRFFPFRQGK